MHNLFIFCLSTVLLTACYKPPQLEDENAHASLSTVQTENEKQKHLLKEMSGVWVENNSLITIQLDAPTVHLILDDSPIQAKLGDIDVNNETVNIIVTKLKDYSDGIITLRRHWNAERTEFTLSFTNFDGSRGELGFIRQIGKDDQMRIERIYAEALSKQYELQEQKTSLAEQLAQNAHQYEATEAEDYYEEDDTAAEDVSQAAAEAVAAAEETEHTVEDAVAAANAAAEAALDMQKQQSY